MLRVYWRLKDNMEVCNGVMSTECTCVSNAPIQCEDLPDCVHSSLARDTITSEQSEFWVFIGIYVTLVLFAGLLSGLSLGLLSLDLTTLRVLKDAGKASERKHAARIMPLVRRHHLLLVTLLLANTACVEAMPIFLDKVSDPITAVLVSVTAVLIFGEVIPQAICTRYGLAIGATMAPLVYVLMALLFIIAWPLSKLLDLLLGEDHGTFFRRAELKALVALHGSIEASVTDKGQYQTTNPKDEEQLTTDEIVIIKGALDMRDKTVRHAMIPIHKIFMLDINDVLDEETMTKILDCTFSRIPVYEGSAHQVVGILMVKTLIKVDTREAIPIRFLKGTNSLRTPHFVPEDMSLFDLLNYFQTGKNHLSIVHMSEHYDADVPNSPAPLPPEVLKKLVIGIITLEDIIEELLQEEIFDETDLYTNEMHKMLGIAIAKTAAARNGREMRRSISPEPSAIAPHREFSKSDTNLLIEEKKPTAMLFPYDQL